MEMEEDEDPYAFILEIYKTDAGPSSEVLLLTHHQPPHLHNPIIPMSARVIDHSLDADGSVLSPESIYTYLWSVPGTSHPDDGENIDNNNTTTTTNDDRIEGQWQHGDDNQNDWLYIDGRDNPTPLCVVSYQTLSPPESPNNVDFATVDEIDDDYAMVHDVGLWLSQLKSMAIHHRLFSPAFAIVTQFRDSEYWRPPSLSISTFKKHLGSRRKARTSAAKSTDVGTSKSLFDDQTLMRASDTLIQLKSMAIFPLSVVGHATSFVTSYRNSNYWFSLSPFLSDSTFKKQLGSPREVRIIAAKSTPVGTSKSLFENPALMRVLDTLIDGMDEQPGLSVSRLYTRSCDLHMESSSKNEHPLKRPKRDFLDLIEVKGLVSSSKSKGKKASSDRPLKKQKHCNTNLNMESSTHKIGSGFNELGVIVSVSSDSEEEHPGRFIGLSGGTRANIVSTSTRSKNTGNLNKSKGVSSMLNAN